MSPTTAIRDSGRRGPRDTPPLELDIRRVLPSLRRDTPADDRVIREQLLRELDERGLVPTRHVNVVVTDGVVHLWGLVDGPEQARAIRVAAETIPGVRAVEDHLGRRPPYTGGE